MDTSTVPVLQQGYLTPLLSKRHSPAAAALKQFLMAEARTQISAWSCISLLFRTIKISDKKTAIEGKVSDAVASVLCLVTPALHSYRKNGITPDRRGQCKAS
jgi:hypothetical protein